MLDRQVVAALMAGEHREPFAVLGLHPREGAWLDIDWGSHRQVRDLNGAYQQQVALHQIDFTAEGFACIAHDDAKTSVISFTRHAPGGSFVVAVCNFTPMARHRYRIGVPLSRADQHRCRGLRRQRCEQRAAAFRSRASARPRGVDHAHRAATGHGLSGVRAIALFKARHGRSHTLHEETA